MEDLIRISVGGGGGTRASLHSDTVEDLIRISVGGGGGTRASLHSDTVEDLIRISVEGQVWKMLMLERVWPAGLAEAKDQGQTTGVGHQRVMRLQWKIVHNTLSHEMFSLKPLKHLISLSRFK